MVAGPGTTAAFRIAWRRRKRALGAAVLSGPSQGMVTCSAADAGAAAAAHIPVAPTTAPTTAIDDQRRPRPGRRDAPAAGTRRAPRAGGAPSVEDAPRAGRRRKSVSRMVVPSWPVL